jgi:serine phosphatase RsbU (regulator of sigma subunit)
MPIGGFLVVFLLVISFLAYRRSRKDNKIIEEQKERVDQAFDQLEEKNTEILDSINYAKRIQSAILPPDKLIKQHLPNSFILYKPKDIVAGDFYWLEPTSNGVLFAAADCTGHGVPGAMVSVVCNNGLNRSTREYGLTEPGEILDKTREIVISEFEKSEEEVKDGMDIALCSLEGNNLKYSGANNPLWIIRSHADERDEVSGIEGINGDLPAGIKTEKIGGYILIEVKADKQPIGKYALPKPYTTRSIELQRGDTFYLFSDGFADQFGGERGKKFKAANFKKLLVSIQNESIQKQKELIDEAFENWKNFRGNVIDQLDDVCIIGVRMQ